MCQAASPLSNFSRSYGQTNPILTGSIVGLQAGDNITATFIEVFEP